SVVVIIAPNGLPLASIHIAVSQMEWPLVYDGSDHWLLLFGSKVQLFLIAVLFCQLSEVNIVIDDLHSEGENNQVKTTIETLQKTTYVGVLLLLDCFFALLVCLEGP